MSHYRVLRLFCSCWARVADSILTQVQITRPHHSLNHVVVLRGQVFGLVDVAPLNLVDLVGHQVWHVPCSWCSEPHTVHTCLHSQLNWIIIELLHSGSETSRCLCWGTWPAGPTQVNLLEWLDAVIVSRHFSILKGLRVITVTWFLEQSLHLLLLKTNELVNILVNLLQAKFVI